MQLLLRLQSAPVRPLADRERRQAVRRRKTFVRARSGRPISAKYEVEKGKLQLSVYTAKGDSFSEVIVNHKNGKIAKREPITGGDDLTAAKSQNEAMSKAKTSLQTAVSKAVKANKGYK